MCDDSEGESYLCPLDPYKVNIPNQCVPSFYEGEEGRRSRRNLHGGVFNNKKKTTKNLVSKTKDVQGERRGYALTSFDSVRWGEEEEGKSLVP